MEVFVNAVRSLGLLLAMAFVVYWCYALRIVMMRERNVGMKLFFVAMLILFPPITPAIIYIIYLNVFKRKQLIQN